MWLIMFTFFKKIIIWLTIYIFMIKIMFNFICIDTYACVTCYSLLIIWLIIFIFIIKIVFNLNASMCLHGFHANIILKRKFDQYSKGRGFVATLYAAIAATLPCLDTSLPCL